MANTGTQSDVTQSDGHAYTPGTGVTSLKYRGTNQSQPLSHSDVDNNFEILRLAINGLVSDLDTVVQTDVPLNALFTDTTYAAVTDSVDGLMTTTLKSKLDNIAANAEVNVQSDWNVADDSLDTFIANKPSIAYTSAISNATTSAAGLMSISDKTKLDGIAENATAGGSSGGASVTTDVSPPGEPSNGDLWFDEDTARLYVHNDSLGGWIQANGTTGGAGGVLEMYRKWEIHDDKTLKLKCAEDEMVIVPGGSDLTPMQDYLAITYTQQGQPRQRRTFLGFNGHTKEFNRGGGLVVLTDENVQVGREQGGSTYSVEARYENGYVYLETTALPGTSGIPYMETGYGGDGNTEDFLNAIYLVVGDITVPVGQGGGTVSEQEIVTKKFSGQDDAVIHGGDPVVHAGTYTVQFSTPTMLLSSVKRIRYDLSVMGSIHLVGSIYSRQAWFRFHGEFETNPNTPDYPMPSVDVLRGGVPSHGNHGSATNNYNPYTQETTTGTWTWEGGGPVGDDLSYGFVPASEFPFSGQIVTLSGNDLTNSLLGGPSNDVLSSVVLSINPESYGAVTAVINMASGADGQACAVHGSIIYDS